MVELFDIGVGVSRLKIIEGRQQAKALQHDWVKR